MIHEIDIWMAPMPIPSTHGFTGSSTAVGAAWRREQQHLASTLLRRHALSETVAFTVAPETWKFVEGRRGKPTVDVDKGLPEIFFNCAHAEDVVAVAASRSCMLGLDLERSSQTLQLDVTLFLSPKEQQWLNEMSMLERNESLLRLWTLKEAYTKLTGQGLSMDVSTIGFSLEPLGIVEGTRPNETIHLTHQCITQFQRPYYLSLASQCYPFDSIRCTYHFLDKQWELYDTDTKKCDYRY
ncbi:MAG: 4'-phosphopantetheinyl transferase superfamily protein [Phycisphaeraceae bacterium]|nr:4'-phosphopantetheinyl transferase superfamily protein [Phycisphaeraceae bacterium]